MDRDFISHGNLVSALRGTIPSGDTPVEITPLNGPMYVYRCEERHSIGTSWEGPLLPLEYTPSAVFEPIVTINGVVLALGKDYTRTGGTLDLTLYVTRSGYVKTDGDILIVYYFPDVGPGCFSVTPVCVRVSARYTVADEADGVTLSIPYVHDPSRRHRVFVNGVRLTPGIEYRFDGLTVVIPQAFGVTASYVIVEYGTTLESMELPPESPGDWASFTAVPDLVGAPVITDLDIGSLVAGGSTVFRCGDSEFTAAELVALKVLATA